MRGVTRVGHANAKIPGGYILLSRKLIESEIWDKPPLYLKVWLLLLVKAQHKSYKGLERGQLWFRMPDIQKQCSWKIGFRTITPTVKQIRDVIDWLRNPNGKISCKPDEGTVKGNMIVSMKGTHGMLANVVNYDFYQNPNNYEGHDEGQNDGNTKGTRRAQYKQECSKKDKNEQECNTSDASPHRQIISYFSNKHFQSTSFKYAVSWAKDVRIIKDLLRDYEISFIQELIDWYFSTDDIFINQAGRSVIMLRTALPKFIAHKQKGSVLNGTGKVERINESDPFFKS